MTRPGPEEILDRLAARGVLNREQVQTAALDVLDWLIRTLDAGMEIATRESGQEWVRMNFLIPGLTTEPGS